MSWNLRAPEGRCFGLQLPAGQPGAPGNQSVLWFTVRRVRLCAIGLPGEPSGQAGVRIEGVSVHRRGLPLRASEPEIDRRLWHWRRGRCELGAGQGLEVRLANDAPRPRSVRLVLELVPIGPPEEVSPCPPPQNS